MKNFLNQDRDILNLVLFRILFGGIMFIEMIHYWSIPFIDELLLKPKVHFTFVGLDFIQPLSLGLMKILLAIATLATLLIMTGRFFRPAIITFTLIYAYFFLIDKTYYNNHIYFILNLSFLLCFVKADGPINSSTGKGNKTQIQTIPYWQTAIFQFMFFVVYFYGGLAKLNADWLSGTITARWLENHKDISLFQTHEAAEFFAITGLVFDLIIGFLLFIPKTRKIAFILCLIFNTSNAILFDDISIFPYLMIGSLTLFADPAWIRTKLGRLIKFAGNLTGKKPVQSQSTDLLMPKWLFVFAAFHILFPFRQVFFEGNTDWTGKAQFFSWRMKSNFKINHNITFYLTHDNHPEKIRVPVEEYLVYEQFYVMPFHPDMLVQFARFLKKDLETKGVKNPVITAVTDISMNGRPFQPIVDSTTDLSSIKLSMFKNYDWVTPLRK